jgi:pyridoxine 5-phosphate synthase
MPELTVKLDPVAELRGLRNTAYPDPTVAAVLAELAGADRIAVSFHRNRKNVSDRDIGILSRQIQTELVLELFPTTGMIGFAIEAKPDRVTLIGNTLNKGVVDPGLDLLVKKGIAAELISTLKHNHIGTAVCIDPDPDQIRLAHKISASMVQFNVGEYCRAKTSLKRNRSYLRIMDAVNLARKLKLRISIGNGLCYKTVRAFTHLDRVDEICVGHGLISRAVLVGMDRAVREMADLIKTD